MISGRSITIPTDVVLGGKGPDGKDLTRTYPFLEFVEEAMDAHAPNGATKQARRRHAVIQAKIDDARAARKSELVLLEEEWQLVREATDGFAMRPRFGCRCAAYDSAVDNAPVVDLQIVVGAQSGRAS